MRNFLKNAIREGVSRGIGDAVSKAVREAVEPRATELTNKAAQYFDQAAGNAAQETRKTASDLEGAFANLERATQSYATQRGKNIKICPGCGEPTTAEKTFCPACGERLPLQTLAEAAVCTACGKQNNLGTRFCEDCGAKLPAAIQEEQAQLARDQQELARWEEWLSHYPKWDCGGSQYNLEEYEPGIYGFSAGFSGDSAAARRAVEQYRQLLQQNGFRQAGQYPNICHLYKMEDGVCYHADTEHCFDGDPDRACLGFDIREPLGGFHYVKPQPKKPASLRDLFKFR